VRTAARAPNCPISSGGPSLLRRDRGLLLRVRRAAVRQLLFGTGSTNTACRVTAFSRRPPARPHAAPVPTRKVVVRHPPRQLHQVVIDDASSSRTRVTDFTSNEGGRRWSVTRTQKRVVVYRGDAAAGARGRRLSDRAASMNGIRWNFCGRCSRRRARRLQGRQYKNDKRRSVAPAWCWCGSGRAAQRAWCFIRWDVDETGIANIVVWPKVMEHTARK